MNFSKALSDGIDFLANNAHHIEHIASTTVQTLSELNLGNLMNEKKQLQSQNRKLEKKFNEKEIVIRDQEQNRMNFKDNRPPSVRYKDENPSPRYGSQAEMDVRTYKSNKTRISQINEQSAYLKRKIKEEKRENMQMKKSGNEQVKDYLGIK